MSRPLRHAAVRQTLPRLFFYISSLGIGPVLFKWERQFSFVQQCSSSHSWGLHSYARRIVHLRT